jgi:2-polyprenyl-6-methoxyphenol hydroxylase-like FAD-dependent oxidoreductase
VLIIGGGLGGLCLAQGLKKSRISVAVYERDSSARFRNQGYRISIKNEGSQALRVCLPENLFNLCVATAIKTATRLVLLDQQLHPQFAKPLSHSIPGEEGFGVNRRTLREILLAGLKDMVQFGKTCQRFDLVEGGQVRTSFSDGTAATGDLLVGADGTHSAIRALIAPDAMIDTLHYAIYGKTPIRSDTLDWMPAILVDNFNRITTPGGIGMSVATCRQVESAATATAKFAPTLHLTDIPEYFSWTLSLTEALGDADEPTLHQHARSLVKEWHPALRRLIDEADIPATFPVPITSARPVKAWHTPDVTLLGDAIHTMSPGRGEGANVALRDAQLLCHTW